MDVRTYAVHAPALSLQEAAMLPAQPGGAQAGMPRNLLISRANLDFRHGAVDGCGGNTAHSPGRRGTMAGRALLRYVENASADRRRR